MGKTKKFGTFSGVFTPSILTILGVIMYLRFPTIIGQAGLINTLAIIIIAHIISVTTSLSVASLSTDKTVKTGGTYFMISRSLGLPIGGTLGLALFVGLSFSVSLYLIGFAESFLTYWNLDSSIYYVRIAGTAILVIVTVITFISTSLAIKSQYFIMAAIALSLLSIFLGHHAFPPKEVHLKPLADAAPFMVLFGIFFPAVTGFEAGVSMSGDLKNPKRSLPLGAISAVLVGFIVYVGLAFFYTYTVDAETLKNDPQILFKISLSPPLVIAGIWGATLSSAFGSILGAPRILQAIAMDKIAPKMFARGSGKTNEPRNALLLAFAIAESGILIGQLDVIARIVSMFFITTYAFLNLASAIESWSSSDFRPAFKIPKAVSLLGASAAFIVMILLDFMALVGAVIVLGLLYFFLKRKELILDKSDAWGSFWTNIAKQALLRLNKQKINMRNWRPNIILFSGGQHSRPHLVELGLALTGKLGALTDFELISENDKTSAGDLVIPKSQKQDRIDFFSRKFKCDTIENGIKTVTSVYGFSGFEPNTIMMGWSRNIQNADFLANVLTYFKNKNLNAVFLDYNKEHGFGKKENIDIWWNGKGRVLGFAIALSKFILSSAEWRDANLRIMIINNDATKTERLHRNTSVILEEARINAEIVIIENGFENRSVEMIIKSESANSDLLLIGVSPRARTYTHKYIENINRLSSIPASLLVVSPSSEFEEINLIDPVVQMVPEQSTGIVVEELVPIPEINNKMLKIRIGKLDEDIQKMTTQFVSETFEKAGKVQLSFIHTIKEQAFTFLDNLESELSQSSGLQLPKNVHKSHQAFLNYATTFFEKQSPAILNEIKEIFELGLKGFNAKLGNYIFEAPESILVHFIQGEKEKNVTVPYRKILDNHFKKMLFEESASQLANVDAGYRFLFAELKNSILTFNDLFENLIRDTTDRKEKIKAGKEKISIEIEAIENDILQQSRKVKTSLPQTARKQINSFVNESSDIRSINRFREKISSKSGINFEQLETFPEEWEANVTLLNNGLFLDCFILHNQKMIGRIIDRTRERITDTLSEKAIVPVNKLLAIIEKGQSVKQLTTIETGFMNDLAFRELFREAHQKISEFIEEFPKEIEIPDHEREENKSAIQNPELTPFRVEPYRIARFELDTVFSEPYYRLLENLETQVKQIMEEFREINSLIRFRVSNPVEQEGQESLELNDQFNILNKLKAQLTKAREKLDFEIGQLNYQSELLIRNAFSPLFSHSIIDSEKKISQQIRVQKSRKINVGFIRKIRGIRKAANDQIVNLLYSKSSGIILAKKYLKQSDTGKTSISQILDLTEKLIPDKKAFAQIPVFYMSLFRSKSFINDDFWITRDEETNKIKNARKRHKDGHGGAILITGEHSSGKTALTRYATNHFFRSGHIFNIYAPVNGSINFSDWEESLRMATQKTGTVDDIIRSMPTDSIIVLNDLELWWERSNDGYVVIEEIMKLVRSYSHRIFFLLNCNIHSYHIINKVLPIDDSLLSIIECSPFDSKQIQQLILKRHKASGLSFEYKGQDEEAISPIKMAALFNSYYNYSKGIPGVALNTWLGHIQSANDQTLILSHPELPNTEFLKNIDKDWLVVIALFIQHKNMDAEKLARIMTVSKDNAGIYITRFQNAGILTIREGDIYTLNKYLEPFLVHVCIEKGII